MHTFNDSLISNIKSDIFSNAFCLSFALEIALLISNSGRGTLQNNKFDVFHVKLKENYAVIYLIKSLVGQQSVRKSPPTF